MGSPMYPTLGETLIILNFEHAWYVKTFPPFVITLFFFLVAFQTDHNLKYIQKKKEICKKGVCIEVSMYLPRSI